MSGGACSVLADACEAAGLHTPAFSSAVRSRLAAIIPAHGGTNNPVDITASAIGHPAMVRQVLRAVRSSGEVDLVLLQLSTNADPAAEQMARDLIACWPEEGTPFLVGRLGGQNLAPRAVAAYAQAGLPVFSWPEELVEAAVACVSVGRLQA
jgi:acyl-CoA synthetase (NDP forming)